MAVRRSQILLYSNQDENRSYVSYVLNYVSKASNRLETAGDSKCYVQTLSNGIKRRMIYSDCQGKQSMREAGKDTWRCMQSAAGKAMRHNGPKQQVVKTRR